MEKLIELANAQISIVLWGPSYQYGDTAKKWHLVLKKETSGVKLEIDGYGYTPSEAVEEAYKKWIGSTRGLPDMSLNQIEHIVPPAPEYMSPPSLDDEIPF